VEVYSDQKTGLPATALLFHNDSIESASVETIGARSQRDGAPSEPNDVRTAIDISRASGRLFPEYLVRTIAEASNRPPVGSIKNNQLALLVSLAPGGMKYRDRIAVSRIEKSGCCAFGAQQKSYDQQAGRPKNRAQNSSKAYHRLS
jgi:hypothetical protein